MRIFILEPVGHKSYQLFDTMEETFRQMGHEFCHDVADADVVFYDLWNIGGIYCKRDVDKVLFWQRPVVGFDFKDQWGSPNHRPNWWGFDGFLILHKKAGEGQAWAIHLKQFLEAGLVKLMFMRKMCKSWDYFDWVRPIECCIYPGHDFEPATEDEFWHKRSEVCWIGNATPWRANFMFSLGRFRESGEEPMAIDCFFPNERVSNAEWIARHRDAFMFVEADGGGFGSERPYQLGFLAAMLKQKNDQRMAFPWTDGVNCVEIGDELGRVEFPEWKRVSDLCNSPHALYQIYLNGIQHLRDHYTPEARSRYVLEQMEIVDLK